ncbi:MAG TPA: hypothetical protein VGH19_02855 [Verrucomicrobiae bacterium]
MRPFISQALTAVTLSTLMLSGAGVFALEAPANPYADIVTRNAFGLKPPEAPKPVEPPKEEAAPSNIAMTGITSINGRKLLYLKVTTPGEKDPVKYLTLAENERMAGIEVTEIIPKTGKARIKNRGVPSIISFDTHGIQSVSAAASVPVPLPGRPVLPGTLGGVPPVPVTAPAVSTTAAPVSSALPAAPNNSAINSMSTGAGGNTATPRTIPSRPLRINSSGNGASHQAPAAAPNINPTAQAVQMEINSQIQPADFPPLPK